jgi:protein O-mannosyl-transferase
LYVTDNPHVRSGLTSDSIKWALTTITAPYWHPLTWLSHMLDCELHALQPGFHHLTNVLIHVTNTLLLLLILTRITDGFWPSVFTAALFGLHPLHVESVAWVAERKDVLSGFFGLLTILAYTRYVAKPSVIKYLLTLLFFVLGLMSKPMLVTLPFLLLLLDYWPLARFTSHAFYGHTDGSSDPDNHECFSESLVISRFNMFERVMNLGQLECFLRDALRLVWEKVPLFILSAIICIMTIIVQRDAGAVPPLEWLPIEMRVGTALVAYVSYLTKFIWPTGLAVFYPYPAIGFPILQVAGAGLLLLAISVFVIRRMHQRPYLFVGWLWYLGMLLPVIGLIQAGEQMMADRFTYLPLTGVCVMISWGVPEFLSKWPYRRFWLALGGGIFTLAITAATWIQVSYWRDSETLFTHALEVTENNYLAHNNLGYALRVKGNESTAVFHFSEALRIKPDFEEANNNLANYYSKKGRYDEAVKHYFKALAVKPENAKTRYNLGIVYLQKRMFNEAIQQFSEAIRLSPGFAGAYNNLGSAYYSLGNYQKSIDCYLEALRINPNYAIAKKNLRIAHKKLEEVRAMMEQ